ncbi:MAG: multidrug efflux RND transporter permease subunit [Pirellulales bacterium]
MISRFFIDRPIFATVLSVLITLAGGIAVFTLPLAQFPPVSPPTVTVTCTYPGASAKDVSEAVAAPIEQQVNGVEGMMFMSSSCTNDGGYTLNVTFHHGTNINMAQVMVQNRVSLAVPSLPDVIKQTGVTVRKQSPDILMGIALFSGDQRFDQLYLSNYAVMQIKDELARLDGVSDVMLFGQRDYSMRIWLDPELLASRHMSASDVVRAIREQNLQLATGSIGQPPAPDGQQSQLTLSLTGRLTEVEQFEQIIVKSHDGRLVRLKDVARVDLAAKSASVSVSMDGTETVFLAIFQMPDANALKTRDRVLAKMDELKERFPEGVEYDIGFDTTPYTRESIKEVFNTLRDAVILVAVVVLLFLQNWRSAIIPLLAVPVAIVGTFAAMAMFGFSLNNLTLFGLVLAIGIVVDDAIVVVEAVEHHIENGLAPRAATIAAMQQVSGAVIAVGLVLSAVFIPCAFISGITGQFFRQFALTISVSTIISTFNSLTLSPALAALLLRPHDKEHKNAAPPLPRLVFPLLAGWLGWTLLGPRLETWMAPWLKQFSAWAAPWIAPTMAALACGVLGWFAGRYINLALGWLFRTFDRAFRLATTAYTRLVGGLLRVSVLVLVVYGGLLFLTYERFTNTAKGFIPSQDMGYLLVAVQLPDAAANERTKAVVSQIVDLARETPGIRHVSGIVGQSFIMSANGSNFGTMFINLKPYDERRDPSLLSDAIANQLRAKFAKHIKDAQIFVFGPPPVRGAGRAGGFMIMIEDRGDIGPAMLQTHVDEIVRAANAKQGQLFAVSTAFRANVPQYHISPDPGQCMIRGVSLQDFADTLRFYEGSMYVNDFNLYGRTWQVIVQAEYPYRDRAEYIPKLKVRNNRGQMVPLGSLASIHEINGPLLLTRYNMYPAASVNGYAAPGVSSSQAISIMEELANQLPRNMSYEWTDMSYLELLAGNTATVIFGFAVVMVFLVLAAQYENWSLPLAVILVVPMCLLCAIIGVNIAKLDVNIFTRVGFVVLVGLASKNAILIVEFAKQERLAGSSRREATLAACQLRLRPIIMTSLAFILGVLPLLLAQGAGAEMRKALGTAVFSGMLGVTLFGLVLTPVFFNVVDWFSETRWLAFAPIRTASNALLSIISPRPLWRWSTSQPRRWTKSASQKKSPPPAPAKAENHSTRPDGVVEISVKVPAVPPPLPGAKHPPVRSEAPRHPN